MVFHNVLTLKASIREINLCQCSTNKKIANEKANQLHTQQLELEKGLSNMYSSRQPVQKRPRSSIQQKNLKPSCLLQIKSVLEAKIKHIISKVGQKRDHSCDRTEHEHIFTFPFTTVDNSLHSSCTNLKDFSNHLQDDDIHDAVYSQNNFAPSIINDANSVKSVSPGCDMDNDMMDFGLAW